MAVKIFIDGAAGTTGLEIRERLAKRGDLALIALDEAKRKDAAARRAALNDAEILRQAIPGCDEIEKTSDTSFTAKVTAKDGG